MRLPAEGSADAKDRMRHPLRLTAMDLIGMAKVGTTLERRAWIEQRRASHATVIVYSTVLRNTDITIILT